VVALTPDDCEVGKFILHPEEATLWMIWRQEVVRATHAFLYLVRIHDGPSTLDDRQYRQVDFSKWLAVTEE
jgi:hypothetical protein